MQCNMAKLLIIGALLICCARSSIGSASENVSFWKTVLQSCNGKPTIECMKENLFKYLKNTLEQDSDVQFTSFMKFARNLNNYTASSSGNVNVSEKVDESLEELSRHLHDTTIKFLMTHDLELELPDYFFQRTVLKFSPRSFENNGALIKFEFLPNIRRDLDVGEGRLLFKPFKNIKKFINERLMYALMAILLVVKMLAAKFLFILPTIIGAAAAKKLILKIMLFVFPALNHLFKLCAYVPHGTKFHHHKHVISHIHHLDPHKAHPPHHGPIHHGHPHHGPHGGIEVIAPHADGPPSLHHFTDKEPPPHEPYFNPGEHELDYYQDGAGITNQLVHRQDSKHHEENDIWSDSKYPGKVTRPLAPSEIEKMLHKSEREAKLKLRLQQDRNRIRMENVRLQSQLLKAIKLQEKLTQHSAAVNSKVTTILKPQFIQSTNSIDKVRPPNENVLPQQTHGPLSGQLIPYEPQPFQKPSNYTPSAAAAAVMQHSYSLDKVSKFEKDLRTAAAVTYDSFYSPILEKIDRILNGLGIHDEVCRERLICSMYENPIKFSPHSNLLSAELSRDPNELQKPANTNAAVVRFYKYVQAARDGQDKRDCTRLYAKCTIIIE